jgi:hypothetical protein
MTTIQISLDDKQLTQLQQKAAAMNLPSASALIEQVVKQIIKTDNSSKEGLALSTERSTLLEDIINENRELLQRLAQ